MTTRDFTICVLGSQHALISGQRPAPAGVSLVVAGTVYCSESGRRIAFVFGG